MKEITLAGNVYRIGKMGTFDQFHLTRKLAPIVPKLAPALIAYSKSSSAKSDDGIEGLVGAFAPFADMLASMSKEDSEFILVAGLSVVQRMDGAGWVNAWNTAANVPQFQDIGLDVMLPLVVAAIRENLGNFIQGLLSSVPLTQAAPA